MNKVYFVDFKCTFAFVVGDAACLCCVIPVCGGLDVCALDGGGAAADAAAPVGAATSSSSSSSSSSVS